MACTSADPAGGPTYDSVRDRLSDGPTRLAVELEASTGSITARRWTSAGWVEGTTDITITDGDLVASLDGSALEVAAFEVGVAPIEIPEEVFKKPAQLSDVRLALRKPAVAAPQWTGDDDGTVRLTVELDLDWAIAINGGKTPLGTQHLPPIEVDVAFTGAGDHVDASVHLAAAGELWNWAGLIEATALEMSLAASLAN